MKIYFFLSQNCIFFQGGNTLGMEESHHSLEVASLEQHAADRWSSSRETESLPQDPEQPVIRTSERVGGEEGEDESDFTSILLPVDSKERRVLLRRAGVGEIDHSEKEECREVRLARQSCGCSCSLYCLPASCPCIRHNIKCQVDRPGFPCSCTAPGCLNKAGRLEFNPVKVRTHFVRTIMRTRLEAARYLPSPTLGYLAHMASASSSSPLQYSSPEPGHHWVPGSWWTFSPSSLDTGHTADDTQEESASSDSDEDLYAEVLEEEEEDDEEEEEVEETVVTEDIRLVVPSHSDSAVGDILDTLLQSVTGSDPDEEEEEEVVEVEVEVEDYQDEGISSDSCYEDIPPSRNHTDNEVTEEDSSDRSEGFVEDTSCQEDGETEPQLRPSCQYSKLKTSTTSISELGVLNTGTDDQTIRLPSFPE